jgi:hypothetical protein
MATITPRHVCGAWSVASAARPGCASLHEYRRDDHRPSAVRVDQVSAEYPHADRGDGERSVEERKRLHAEAVGEGWKRSW